VDRIRTIIGSVTESISFTKTKGENEQRDRDYGHGKDHLKAQEGEEKKERGCGETIQDERGEGEFPKRKSRVEKK